MHRKSLIQTVALVLLVGVVLGVGAPAYAEQHAGDKFFRGLVNLTTGWFELPRMIGVTGGENEGNVFIALTWGVARGIGASLSRMGNGLWEMVSFPAQPFEPQIDPATVFLYGQGGRSGVTK